MGPEEGKFSPKNALTSRNQISRRNLLKYAVAGGAGGIIGGLVSRAIPRIPIGDPFFIDTKNGYKPTPEIYKTPTMTPQQEYENISPNEREASANFTPEISTPNREAIEYLPQIYGTYLRYTGRADGWSDNVIFTAEMADKPEEVDRVQLFDAGITYVPDSGITLPHRSDYEKVIAFSVPEIIQEPNGSYYKNATLIDPDIFSEAYITPVAGANYEAIWNNTNELVKIPYIEIFYADQFNNIRQIITRPWYQLLTNESAPIYHDDNPIYLPYGQSALLNPQT